jgi:signal transduction histidine kinase
VTRARLLDLGSFAGCFLLAAFLGRQALLPGTDLAVVWPAVGVAAALLAVTGWSRWVGLDAAVLFVAAWAVHDLTGASTPLALGLAVGTVVQVLVLGFLVDRWCPGMWGFGDEPPPGVQSLRDLGYLTIAAFVSAAVSAVAGPAWVLSVADADWPVVASWVLRNGVAVLAIFPLSLLARNVARSSSTRTGQSGFGPYRGSPIEAAALAVATVGAVWAVFVVNDVPVPFLVLSTCVWAGTRFSSWVPDIHALLLAAGVVAATVLDHGPFVGIDDVDTRALVLQSYLAVVVALNLSLSVGRRESIELHQRLAVSERTATAQAAMMRTMLDTMADGVTVVDAQGGVLLRNPAARELIGDVRLDDRGAVDVPGYSIRHPDGRPLTADEAPTMRALAGETVDHVDLLVHHPAAPDGRLVEVTARPLPDTDPPMVVVVFHDVTADRRVRDELVSFAGVVAHDLLNPLTIIEGWSEALLEDARAPGESDAATQIQRLDRIQRAAQRMQHLINDLLAYATARDRRINPVPVDLAALARDVARARVDGSRVKGEAEPLIRVGDGLREVLAEPVLLRQVLDNLVGNAVKYVAPGVRPDIELRARTVEEGSVPMVLLEVIDNGIGIPDGQHARVFDTFHRAHQDGYRGTGLGLAIVKRIVERHGGTVSARDNDGRGGTTMAVSFPAAGQA